MRNQNGTFGKMKQISTEQDFLNVEKNGFFSMVYAPYEGRLIRFIMSGPNNEPAYIEFKNQKHEFQYGFLWEDDFEIPSGVYLQELQEPQTVSDEEVIAILCSALAFDLDNESAKHTLQCIKSFSKENNIERKALRQVAIAMKVRKKIKNLSSVVL